MKQKLPVLAFLGLFFLFAAWQIPNPSPAAPGEGFVSLFDGRSLDGWYKVGGDSSFRVATLAGLMTYLRRAWGHAADPVSTAQAAALRAQSADRQLPWTVPELEQVAFDRGYAKFVGDYKVSFITMTIFEVAGELQLKVPMYGGGPLRPISGTLFDASGEGQSVNIEFVLEDDGSVNQLLLHRDGQKISLLRVRD